MFIRHYKGKRTPFIVYFDVVMTGDDKEEMARLKKILVSELRSKIWKTTIFPRN